MQKFSSHSAPTIMFYLAIEGCFLAILDGAILSA